MGLYLKQESTRTKLQEKIAAELSEKARKKALEPASELPDGVSDSNYLKDTKQTTSLAWAWLLIVIAVVVLVVWVAVSVM